MSRRSTCAFYHIQYEFINRINVHRKHDNSYSGEQETPTSSIEVTEEEEPISTTIKPSETGTLITKMVTLWTSAKDFIGYNLINVTDFIN